MQIYTDSGENKQLKEYRGQSKGGMIKKQPDPDGPMGSEKHCLPVVIWVILFSVTPFGALSTLRVVNEAP